MPASDIPFKDHFYKSSSPMSNLADLQPYSGIIHSFKNKLWYIAADGSLASVDLRSMETSLMPFKNLEAIMSYDRRLHLLTSTGALTVMNEAGELKAKDINRDIYFLKVAAFKDYIAVTGWREHTKENAILLFNKDLVFLDDFTFKNSKWHLRQLSSYAKCRCVTSATTCTCSVCTPTLCLS